MGVSGIVFDLDDTLYLEQDYVRSGFDYVAKQLEQKSGISSQAAFRYMWRQFEEGVRGHTFDKLFEAYPEISACCSVGDLLNDYRSHLPKISLSADMTALINDIKDTGLCMAIISDGPLLSQQAKVDALGLAAAFDVIILTDRWGRTFWKPHPKGFQEIDRAWGIASSEIVFVGDNPQKDFLTPKKMGWRTIRIRREGQLNFAREAKSLAYEADVEISNVEDLRENVMHP